MPPVKHGLFARREQLTFAHRGDMAFGRFAFSGAVGTRCCSLGLKERVFHLAAQQAVSRHRRGRSSRSSAPWPVPILRGRFPFYAFVAPSFKDGLCASFYQLGSPVRPRRRLAAGLRFLESKFRPDFSAAHLRHLK